MVAPSVSPTHSATMDNGWCNTSSDSVEFYQYDTLDGIAIIFRHRNNRHGYLACISHSGHHLMADVHFSTVDAAKIRVAYQIVRWRSRR